MKLKNITIYILLIIVLILAVFCQSQSGTAQLKFVILDENTQQPIPAKLVFTQGDNDKINLNIPQTFGLAPERNAFYIAFGKGEVEIPAGTYTIYATRGMEYSIDKKVVEIKRGAVVEQQWTITREINPPDYVGADLHMHTTNSDGQCSPEERVSSIVGEGVEFAVAADHNFVTDFKPDVEKLGVGQYVTTCPGNELTTTIGHFNIYPLPPNTEPFDFTRLDPGILFKYRDDLPGPVVNQVNHPRRLGCEYLTYLGVEPVTSESENPLFSRNFEVMEIMNKTIGWGLFTGAKNKISVWDEWFNFLNSGFRATGVGNTDTHSLHGMPVGTPRNYIAASTENPAELDAYEIAQNLIDHKVSVARGVFVNITVNQIHPIGSEVSDTDGAVDLAIEVLAPSWVKVDKVTLYGNAHEIWSEQIKSSECVLHYSKKLKLNPELDTWYVVKAEGSQSLWPIVPDQDGIPVTPVGFTNPVWVDIDGNGFETERDRAKQFIEQHGKDSDSFKAAVKKADWWQQRQIAALVKKDSEFESIMIKNFLSSDVKIAREFAYRRIGEKGNAADIQLLQSTKQSLKDDDERRLVDAYIAKLGPKTELLGFINNSVINSKPGLRHEQCRILSTKKYLRNWNVIGPFANENDAGLSTRYAPENQIDLNESYTDKTGRTIHWQPLTGEKSGYIDLKQITDDANYSVAYAYTSINCPETVNTVLFFGSDDGSAIWHNGQDIYHKFVRRSSNPYDEIIPIELKKGENNFLVKVENGSGSWGFYLEIFDPLNKVFHER